MSNISPVRGMNMPFVGSPLKGDEQETLELTWTERQEYMFVNVDFKEIMRMAKPHFPALELSCCSYEKMGFKMKETDQV